jgi:AraC-like DNA-binding protein
MTIQTSQTQTITSQLLPKAICDRVTTPEELVGELETMRQVVAQINLRLAELEAQQARYQLLVSTLRQEIINSQQQLERETDRSEPEYFQFPEHPQLKKIFTFIEDNYHQSIGLNEIANTFNYTPSYLTSLVRRLTGQSLYQWIVQRRMFQARFLLRSTDWTICQIAEAIGYVDTGHFIKHFRQLHQKPPKTWRDDCDISRHSSYE